MIELAVRFVTSRPPSLTVSFARTRTSTARPFAMVTCMRSSFKKFGVTSDRVQDRSKKIHEPYAIAKTRSEPLLVEAHSRRPKDSSFRHCGNGNSFSHGQSEASRSLRSFPVSH